MKVAVTGASGFLGGYVLPELAALPKTEVVATARTRPANLPKGVSFQPGALAEPVGFYDRLGRPDVVIHLAWSGLPNYASLHHFETELPAQFHFLRTLISDGLPRLLVAGTCYEYGMIDGCLSEGQEARPVTAYGFAKDSLRRQLELLRTVEPFQLIWARLFYMWGRGQAPGSLYSLLSGALDRGDASFPMSGGEQLRDFLPVANVARYLVNLAIAAPENANLVNVCSGSPISVRRLVETWVAERGASIELDLGRYPYPSYEPLAFWGDNRRLALLTSSI